MLNYRKNWPALLGYFLTAVAFVVLSIYLVLYATGYRLDILNWSLEKTGVLAVTTKPPGAMVTLDGKKYGKATPFTLRNLVPGNYHLKLELKDYRSYERDLTIVSNQVTEIHNVDLVFNTVESKTLVEDFEAPVYVDGDQMIYFSSNHKFMRLSDNATPLNFDRAPAHVKTLLEGATGLYLAKKSSGNTVALGILSGAKKTLAILEPDGYRGIVFGTPVNNIVAENLYFIDNDRLVGLDKGTVYTIDLNLNQVVTYAKNVAAINFTGGQLYFVTKDAEGTSVLMSDPNVFDTRVAESVATDLPVAKEYEILLSNDYGLIVNAISATKGVWWYQTQKDNTKKWLKIASGVEDMMYDFTGERLYFISQGSMRSYDMKKREELPPQTFAKSVDILGKRNESIFLSTAGKLMVIDADLTNLYELADSTNATVVLSADSRRILVAKDKVLNELILRKPSGGIFGSLFRPMI